MNTPFLQYSYCKQNHNILRSEVFITKNLGRQPGPIHQPLDFMIVKQLRCSSIPFISALILQIQLFRVIGYSD